jgi:hypothetical protein
LLSAGERDPILAFVKLGYKRRDGLVTVAMAGRCLGGAECVQTFNTRINTVP